MYVRFCKYGNEGAHPLFQASWLYRYRHGTTNTTALNKPLVALVFFL